MNPLNRRSPLLIKTQPRINIRPFPFPPQIIQLIVRTHSPLSPAQVVLFLNPPKKRFRRTGTPQTRVILSAKYYGRSMNGKARSRDEQQK